MVVCKFWLQGNCRFGNNCKFEHTSNNTNNNRFGVFGQATGGGSTTSQSTPAPTMYGVSAAGIVKDLSAEERPVWIFSAYGPGRNAPDQLFGGPEIEQSFEELRLHYYNAAASGNPQTAIGNIDSLYRQAQGQIENAVKNSAEAAQFILKAEQQHPNRLDICKANSQPDAGVFSVGTNRGSGPVQALGGFGAPSAAAKSNPFGSPAAATSSASPFGSSAAATSASPFGSTAAATSASPFGAAPSFGQPAGGSAFGQPSQPGVSAFGKPSQLGGGASFGQPSQLGAGVSAFGKPAAPAFGQASQPTPAFGQPSQPTPAFGQPSQPTPAFGQPTQPGGASGFGQPSQLGSGGASAFGQPSQMGSAPSAFGQPAALGQKTNAFGSPSALGGGAAGGGFSKFAQAPAAGGGSAFGQPSQLGGAAPTAPASGLGGGAFGGTSAFGKPSALGASPSPFGAAASTNASPAANPFGQAAALNNGASPSPFGQPSAAAPATTTPSPFGQAAQASTGATASANPFAAAVNAQTTASPSLAPFGQPSGTGPSSNAFQTAATSPFGQPQQPQQPQQAQSPFGRPTATTTTSTTAAANSNAGPSAATQQHPPLESYAQRNPATGRLQSFNGRRVVYETKDGVETPMVQRPTDGKPAKVWFPNGPPAYNEDTELPREAYTGPRGEAIRKQYESFMSTGRFAAGLIPEAPPLREWCLWNF